ncbi:MAG TPA: hypothetical protein VMW18_17090 [Candidatus Binatia bacterium]|nr:hypothetical protein [Candidatus Binatia bacterium]
MGNRRVSATVGLIAVAFPLIGAFAADPLPFGPETDPTAFCQAVDAAFERSDFDTLDATIKSARTLEARFSGGQTELEGLYRTLISGAFPGYQMSRKDEVILGRVKKLEAWRARKSDPVAPAIILASLWDAYAWVARGDGYANQVPRDRWPIFFDRIKTASTYMQSIDPSIDPEAYSVLLELARDFNRPRAEIDAVFNAARHKFPTYFSYYKDYVTLLEPNWFGRPGDIPRFLQDLRTESNGETGAVAYAYAAEILTFHMAGPDVFRSTGLDWDEVQRTFQVREKAYGLSPEAWNALCYLAVVSGDRAKAREYYRHAAPHLTEWPRWPGGTTGDFYLRVQPWIMARDADLPGASDGPLSRGSN